MVTVNDITVLDANLIADDGIFHGIEAVILPGSFTPCPTGTMAPSSSPTMVATMVATTVAPNASFTDLVIEKGDYGQLLNAITGTPGLGQAIDKAIPVSESFVC
jgi:hypothetical protein